jgi:endoribonuclease Dicer
MKADGEYHVKVEVFINSEVISCAAANQNSKVARKLAAQEALCKLKVCFGSFAFYFLNCYSIPK